jgi:hypothetical protein
VTHLFKGGWIFESIFKHFYPTKDEGDPTEKLTDIFHTAKFEGDFIAKVAARASTLQEVLSTIKGNDLRSAFETTAKLRNTTGHNLVWSDIFAENVYRELFEQEVNAILYVITKKFF